MAGLALVYALDLTRFLKHGTNMASKSEADFNSVGARCVAFSVPRTFCLRSRVRMHCCWVRLAGTHDLGWGEEAGCSEEGTGED